MSNDQLPGPDASAEEIIQYYKAHPEIQREFGSLGAFAGYCENQASIRHHTSGGGLTKTRGPIE